MPLSAIERERALLPEALALIRQGPDAVLALDPSSPVRQLVEHLVQLMGVGLAYIAGLPESKGYEPLLKKHGCSEIAARGLANLTRRVGKRLAKDAQELPKAVHAIRVLARSRTPNKIFDAIGDLLDVWKCSSTLERIFDDAKLEVRGFVRSLEQATAADAAAMHKVRSVAQSLLPHLKLRRGPKISENSFTHEYFLAEVTSKVGIKGRFTSSIDDGDLVDALSQAARDEFKDPDFDPRPACRRLRHASTRSWKSGF